MLYNLGDTARTQAFSSVVEHTKHRIRCALDISISSEGGFRYMGVLDRISTIMRSNINDMLDKAEDPEKMLDQIIRDMASAIEEAKGQVAGVIAQEKLLEAEMNNSKRSADEWGGKAEK